MPRTPQLTPESNFPEEALQQTEQEFPEVFEGAGTRSVYTWHVASAADQVEQWGVNPVRRDSDLRKFYPTEPYLLSAITNIGFRHAALEWEITGSTDRVNQAVTNMLNSAIAGDTFGWVPFILKISQDMCTQDNGAFVELIRDPGQDANSKFKGPLAPVLGIGHLDSQRCTRTGNPEYPVVYTDRDGKQHKMNWWEIIPFSDQPSAVETMNGVGFCAVSRVLRLAQIARSIEIFKDEKIGGRHYKSIHFVSGVSRQDIKDEMRRGQEEANNGNMIRFINPAILASLDPEKPVSTASIDLANLPDGFDFDVDMKWYISGLALSFGVDYQEFAPLPSGNMGSGAQSQILHRKTSGKGPAVFMRMLTDAFQNYGVLPRGVKMRFNDKDEQEALEKQTVRTKAMEEMAMAINSHALTPEAAAKDMQKRGLWDEEIVNLIPPEFWQQFTEKPEMPKQPVGSRSGNTIAEDAKRQDKGKENQTIGDRLRKEMQSLRSRIASIGKAKEDKEAKEPNIVLNIAEAPPPAVKVFTPRQTGSKQKIFRDQRNNMQKVRTELGYDGFVVSSSESQDVPEQAASVIRKEDGTIVINTPTPKQQVINIRMPKIVAEEQVIERDARNNMTGSSKKIIYEDD